VIRVLDDEEKGKLIPEWFKGKIKNHEKQNGISEQLNDGSGRFFSFQIDEDARYTGNVAVCDEVNEVRKFAYPPLILEWRNSGKWFHLF